MGRHRFQAGTAVAEAQHSILNWGYDMNVLPVPPTTAADARNRAFRTFAQGLGIDLSVALLLALAPALVDVHWTKAYWVSLGLLAGKTVVQTAVAYAMRRMRAPNPT